MKRVGIIALLHESNTFLTRPTTLADFEANLLCSGQEVLENFRGSAHEVGGFIDALEHDAEREAVGIFAARAMPYGTITHGAWQNLRERLTDALWRAGRLDGLLVAPHGATVAEQAADADGDWLQHVRSLVGPSIPILGTLDLHANVSPAMIAACDGLFGYRTNPHLDQRARGFTAGTLMAKVLHGAPRPVQTLVRLPFCINIERQATAEPHGQWLWRTAQEIVATTPGVLDVSCLYGFPYADVPEMGASVIAIAEQDRTLAAVAAERMAAEWWRCRHDFVGQLISIDDAIREARATRQLHPTRPVGLLDMGDNVGAGSAGDGTLLLHAWTRACQDPLLAILYDPAAAAAAHGAGVAARLRLTLGGHTDELHGSPFADDFQVIHLSDGRFTETLPTHGGYQQFDQGPTAVLMNGRGTAVMVTSRRVAPLSLQQVLSQALDPTQFAALVIKGVHAPVAVYQDVCSRLIRVNTPGSTCADLSHFAYHAATTVPASGGTEAMDRVEWVPRAGE